ncbi:hypothetical protein ACFFWB_07675 [Flavobacterium procerum]|uniref:hypothetical protein n=1 Tax=Flavobacterium procerum TaxID=1455569 RepID=UPI0035EC5886
MDQTTNATKSGYITYKRALAGKNGFDFTYWSTPVIGATTLFTTCRQIALFDKYTVFDAGGVMGNQQLEQSIWAVTELLLS